tara:strand:- start:1191 stop:2114 length:924 start_codon:yes stop_codon:yes gene_type:complete
MGNNKIKLPSGITHRNTENIRSDFRALLSGDTPFLVPGAVNAISAKLIERTNFNAFFITGAGLANSQYGLPDIGLLSLTEVCMESSKILDATNLPAIIDADTGYGGPLSVMRTIHQLENLGAAAIQLEDQVMPKRCGHFDNKSVIDCKSMVQKLEAAQEARSDPKLVIIARTDARSVNGLDDAIQRGLAYAEAGADAIFVEAPQTIEELETIGEALKGIPLVVNVVEGGKTPQLSIREYEDMGFKIILYANLLLRTMLLSGQTALTHLKNNGTSKGFESQILPWSERQDLVELDLYDDTASRYPESI